MTVSSTVSKVSYAGTGSTTLFSVPFYFLDNTHVKVILRRSSGVEVVKSITTDYTVSGAGVISGGTITMIVAPASGQTLVIARNVPLTQETDYITNDPFPAETHEKALDKLTMEMQQVQEQLDRSVKVSITDTTSPDTLIQTVVNSAASAATSAASAQSNLNSFIGQYYGPLAANPTLDPLGNPPGVGDLYWNTSNSLMRAYNGSNWVDTATASPVTIAIQTFSGTGAQTAFTLSSTPPSLNGITIFISGVAQYPTTDYTYSGTTLTFTTAPPAGTNNISVRVMSALSIGTPADLSVSTIKIIDANITPAKLDRAYAEINAANTLNKANRGAITALTDGATITPDFALANNYSVTLGGNRTLANPTNIVAGQSGVIAVSQDGTGSRTLAYGSYFKFAAGSAPTLTTTASAVDLIAYYVESATRIDCRFVGDVK